MVTDIMIHADYDARNSWINDIALVKVNEPFVVTRTISYVPLPEPGQEVPAASVAVVSGWGSVKVSSQANPSLNRKINRVNRSMNRDRSMNN